MPEIRYVGREPAVEIPALGVAVKRRQTIDVPAAVANDLLRQGGERDPQWEKVEDDPKPDKKTAAKADTAKEGD